MNVIGLLFGRNFNQLLYVFSYNRFDKLLLGVLDSDAFRPREVKKYDEVKKSLHIVASKLSVHLIVTT